MSASDDSDNSQKSEKTVQQSRRQSASMWLASQNEELNNKVKKLEVELYHWKIYANDFNGRLQRLQQNSGKQNYIDTFYDTSIKTFMKTISEENVMLKNELNINDYSTSNSTKRIYELRNLNQELSDQLEIRSVENRTLKKQIEDMKCPDALNELKNNFMKLEKDYVKITVDNTNLKNYARSKDDIMNYLKNWFDKQRNEFIKIFTAHYLEHGDEFIKQLKSLDPVTPEFLAKPLARSIGTNTDNDNTVPPLYDPPLVNRRNQDSGIDDLPDEFCQLMSVNREMDEAKKTINYLEEKLKDENKSTVNLLKLNAELNESVRSLENCMRTNDDEIKKQKRELSESKNECLSWKAACNNMNKEYQQFENERYALERKCKLLEERSSLSGMVQRKGSPALHYDHISRAGITEPHQNVNWQSNMPRSVLVRDSPAKVEKQSPTRNRNPCNYVPRGPVTRKEPIEDDASISSEDIDEQKKLGELHASSHTMSVPCIKCKYCETEICNEEYDGHVALCQRSGPSSI